MTIIELQRKSAQPKLIKINTAPVIELKRLQAQPRLVRIRIN